MDEESGGDRERKDLTSIHVRRAIDGERASVEWVVSHFHPLVESQIRLRLGRHAIAEDVEDLVHEVWLVALRRLSDLQPRDGRHAPVLVRFLGSTALGLVNNHLRKRIRRGAVAQGGANGDRGGLELDQFARETRGVVSQATLSEARGAIQGCLDRLTPDKRDVLVLRVMEQRTNQEIAETLGILPNTVAARYRRALQDLRAGLPERIFADLWEALR